MVTHGAIGRSQGTPHAQGHKCMLFTDDLQRERQCPRPQQEVPQAWLWVVATLLPRKLSTLQHPGREHFLPLKPLTASPLPSGFVKDTHWKLRQLGTVSCLGHRMVMSGVGLRLYPAPPKA